MAIPPPLTPLPTPPSRAAGEADFNAGMDAYLTAFNNSALEYNASYVLIPDLANGMLYSGTSTTSNTVGTGTRTFTIETGRNFQIGQPVRAAWATTPSNYMDGQVISYNPGTGVLVLNITSVGGSGTRTPWVISLIPGAGGSYATLTGVETLTNKTMTTPVLSGTASGTVAGRLGYNAGALTYGDGSAQRTIANLAGVQTLTNKTINLASNTLQTTMAQLNSAISDGDVGVSGLTQIAQIATTSGTTAAFSSIPQTFSSLLMVFNCSHSGGGGSYITLFGSDNNGANAFSMLTTRGLINSTDTTSGAILIPGYTRSSGILTGEVWPINTNRSGTALNPDYAYMWRADAGLNYLRAQWSAGYNFDAGNITLYGL